jgi:hypothetical protein
MYQERAHRLLTRMTPQPLVTYAQMSVSPQRYVIRQRRRRRAAHVLLQASFRQVPGLEPDATTTPRVPAQRVALG